MDIRDSLNQYYYEASVSDLRHLSRSGAGELSYNSIMYLDVMSYQQTQGRCTVSTLAQTLHISTSAVTIKVGELERLGLIEKARSEADRRVVFLRLSETAEGALSAYDRPFERAARAVETQFTSEQIAGFCEILQTFSTEYGKDL